MKKLALLMPEAAGSPLTALPRTARTRRLPELGPGLDELALDAGDDLSEIFSAAAIAAFVMVPHHRTTSSMLPETGKGPVNAAAEPTVVTEPIATSTPARASPR